MKQISNEEIWEGWCGNTIPGSDEGSFKSEEDAEAYVRDRMSDWGNEGLEIDDNGNITRYISDMTDDEVMEIAVAIYEYAMAGIKEGVK